MNNILVAVDKQEVTKQITKLHNYLSRANMVTENSTFSEINSAQKYLYMAKGTFSTLWAFKFLPDWETVDEELLRIEAKHEYILEQKRRNYRPKWRKS